MTFPLLKAPHLTVEPGSGTVDEHSSQSFPLNAFHFVHSYIDKSMCSKPNLIQHRPMDRAAHYTVHVYVGVHVKIHFYLSLPFFRLNREFPVHRFKL